MKTIRNSLNKLGNNIFRKNVSFFINAKVESKSKYTSKLELAYYTFLFDWDCSCFKACLEVLAGLTFCHGIFCNSTSF